MNYKGIKLNNHLQQQSPATSTATNSIRQIHFDGTKSIVDCV